MRNYLLIFLSYMFLAFNAYSQQKVPITIETDIYNYAQEVIDQRDILTIQNFSGSNSQRDVVEFILIQQALALGGSNIEFSFTLGNYDSRNTKLLQSGLLLINFNSMWLSQLNEIKEDVYISDVIIKKGEYWAGLYTALDNEEALTTKNLADFQKRTVISNKHWYVDWKTLTQLKPKTLTHDEEWLSMAKLVSLKWVDIMLAPFTTSRPFTYQAEDYKVIAIEGVKIALNDSRHFAISKKHPYGKETFLALQKGLKILRERGTITKAFQQSGFFNPKVKSWHTLNADFIEERPSNNSKP
jgi:hypothetical protein